MVEIFRKIRLQSARGVGGEVEVNETIELECATEVQARSRRHLLVCVNKVVTGYDCQRIAAHADA